MSKEKKILVFTATYNEAENIEELIKSIKSQPSKPDLLVIDDNSPDETSKKILKWKKTLLLYPTAVRGRMSLPGHPSYHHAHVLPPGVQRSHPQPGYAVFRGKLALLGHRLGVDEHGGAIDAEASVLPFDRFVKFV